MKRLFCVLVVLVGRAQSPAGEMAAPGSAPDSKVQEGPCAAPAVAIPAQENEQMLAVDWLQQFTRDGYGDDPETALPGKLSECAERWRARARATAGMYRLRGVDTAVLATATEKAADGLAKLAKKPPSVKASRSSDVMNDRCLVELARKTQPGSATSVYLELRRRVRNLALADGRLLPRKLLFYKRRNGVVFGYVQGTEDFSARWSRPGHDAWLKSGPGFVHEMRLDGSGLRQITRGERTHDVAPVYLPDGGVAFCSDRNMSGVQCNQTRHDELFTNLYACLAEKYA